MRGVADYAVVYDITCDRERARVDRVLKGFGFRVQKSVFECRLKRRDVGVLIDRLAALDIKTGFVKIYRLDHSVGARVVGRPPDGGGVDEGNAFIV